MIHARENDTSRVRWLAAVILAGVALLYASARAIHEPAWPTDFDQIWHAARALRAGRDPYGAVGPGKSFEWIWPLYYPLPAVLLATWTAWLPVAVARVAFTTIASGALGWAMGGRLVVLWPLMFSASYLIAVSRTQWSPLILASAWVPALAFVAAAKPNIGLAALATHSQRRSIGVAALVCLSILGLSFVVRPDWLGSWLSAVASAPHVTAPIVRPFGALLLLAALKWRRSEARLVLVMACIPHTPSLYDLLPLFFVCRSIRESLGLALLTHTLFWGIILFGSYNTFDLYAAGVGRAEVLVVYLPVLVAILLRPNRDDGPAVEAAFTWTAAVPSTRFDVVLSCALFITAFFLVWLPLMTYR